MGKKQNPKPKQSKKRDTAKSPDIVTQTGRPEAFRSRFTGKCACVYQNDGEDRTEANRRLFRLYDFPIS